MNKKKENMKTLACIIGASLGLFIAIISFSSLFFYVDGQFQLKDYMISSISLAGALIGGIFTMLGVVLTLNRNISDKENEEEKYLKTQAFIVKSEIEAYLDSIEICARDAVCNKTFELSLDANDFDYFCDIFMTFNSIYFMADSVREKFYEFISKLEHDNKKEMINIFIKLYTNHEKMKGICLDKSSNPEDILNKLIVNNFKSELIVLKRRIFDSVESIKKEFKEGRLVGKDLENAINGVIDEYGKNVGEEFLVDEYNKLLKFLEKASE